MTPAATAITPPRFRLYRLTSDPVHGQRWRGGLVAAGESVAVCVAAAQGGGPGLYWVYEGKEPVEQVEIER